MNTVPLSPFVEERLVALFAPAEQELVRKMLIQECGENIPFWKSAGMDRLRCAVLKLSDGQIWKMRLAINDAKIDFRDVLMAADFGGADSHLIWTPGKKW